MENKCGIETYAVKHTNENIREDSRSGGVFTALSDLILECQGVVYGCVLDDEFSAIHIRAIDKDTRDLMRGSKYIQSKLGNTFQRVKEDLINKRKVLFSGTPCQVAGLKSFLGQEYENLLCVDIVCYGVPSSRIWHLYLEWYKQKYYSEIKNVQFRNKKDFGWADHVETITMMSGKRIHSKIFAKLFMGGNILRPSCYECLYKDLKRPGDITIADYWGIDNAAPGFNDNKGVSLVLINSEKGAEHFESIKNELLWKQTKLEDSLQPALVKSIDEPNGRSRFWIEVRNKPFSYIVKKYGEDKLITKVKRKVKNILSRVKRAIWKVK